MSMLLLCDDHRVVREALAALLSAVPGVSTVSQAGSAEEVLARYPVLRPDAVVMDVRLPGLDGVTATVRLLEEHPDARVVVLSGEVREDDRLRVLQAGARGFLPKDIDAVGLRAAVSLVLAGGDLLSPAQRRALAHERPRLTLSPRELQVLEGMAAGRSNAQIGRSLWLSEDTVKVHAKKLYAKTGVHDRAAAVAWAFRSGVLA
ncbi:MAG: two component transcriptional regulator, LuxR family [Frankiales bacterium]|nr:two component transcriptional regulator, LuxR family [Frankiales bacterium]